MESVDIRRSVIVGVDYIILVSGDESKYTIAKRLTTALELQNAHSTSDAVVT